MVNPNKPALSRLLPILLVMAMILLMSTTPGDLAGDIFNFVTAPLRDFLRLASALTWLLKPDWFKVGHVIAYAVLGALLYRGFLRAGKHNLLGPMLIVFGFACLDELVQYFIPGRSASFSDVLLDTSAAFLAMMTVKLIAERQQL